MKLQASLDGELSEREARRVSGWLATDPAAQGLLAELRMAKTALAGNEPEIKVPESREFYWSKIEREIHRAAEVQARSEDTPLFAWRGFLAPLTGVALVALLAVGTAWFYTSRTTKPEPSYLAEIENHSENTGSLSFRSQSENMLVVWVSTQNGDAGADSQLIDDSVTQ